MVADKLTYKLNTTILFAGIANTVSRVALGWVGDRKCINRLGMMISLQLIAAASTIVSPFLVSFETKLIYCIATGVSLGNYGIHLFLWKMNRHV